jgi:hypothetical protein
MNRPSSCVRIPILVQLKNFRVERSAGATIDIVGLFLKYLLNFDLSLSLDEPEA